MDVADLFESGRRGVGEGGGVREPLGYVGGDVVASAGPGGREVEDPGELGELDSQFVQDVGSLPVAVGCMGCVEEGREGGRLVDGVLGQAVQLGVDRPGDGGQRSSRGAVLVAGCGLWADTEVDDHVPYGDVGRDAVGQGTGDVLDAGDVAFYRGLQSGGGARSRGGGEGGRCPVGGERGGAPAGLRLA